MIGINFTLPNAKDYSFIEQMDRMFSNEDIEDRKEKDIASKKNKSIKEEKFDDQNGILILEVNQTNQNKESNEDECDIHESLKIIPLQLSSEGKISFEYSEKEKEHWKICHQVFQKKNIMDIEQLIYIPFIKRKKNESVFSLIGLGNQKRRSKEMKYFAVLDEQFIYMINMTLKENNNNKFIKTVGNHYDIKKIDSIDIKDDEKERKCITIKFIYDDDINNFKYKIKEFIFEEMNAVKFLKLLKHYITIFKLIVNYKNVDLYIE